MAMRTVGSGDTSYSFWVPDTDYSGRRFDFNDYMDYYKPVAQENPYTGWQGADWSINRRRDYRDEMLKAMTDYYAQMQNDRQSAIEAAIEAAKQREIDAAKASKDTAFSEWTQGQPFGEQGQFQGIRQRDQKAGAGMRSQWEQQYQLLLSQGYKPWEAKQRVADLTNKAPDNVPEAVRNSVNPEWVKRQKQADAAQRLGWGAEDLQTAAWNKFMAETKGEPYNPDENPDIISRTMDPKLVAEVQKQLAEREKVWRQQAAGLMGEGYSANDAIEAIHDMNRWKGEPVRQDIQDAMASADARNATLSQLGQKRKFTENDWSQIMAGLSEMSRQADNAAKTGAKGPEVPELLKLLAKNPGAKAQLRDQLGKTGLTGLPEELVRLFSPLNANELMAAQQAPSPKTYRGYSGFGIQGEPPDKGVSTSPSALESQVGVENPQAKAQAELNKALNLKKNLEYRASLTTTPQYLQGVAIDQLLGVLGKVAQNPPSFRLGPERMQWQGNVPNISGDALDALVKLFLFLDSQRPASEGRPGLGY